MGRQEQETLQQKPPSRRNVEGKMDCFQNKKSPRRPWKRMQTTAACGEATLELLQTFLSDCKPCNDIHFLFTAAAHLLCQEKGWFWITHCCLQHCAAPQGHERPTWCRTCGGVVSPEPSEVSLLLSNAPCLSGVTLAKVMQNLLLLPWLGKICDKIWWKSGKDSRVTFSLSLLLTTLKEAVARQDHRKWPQVAPR